MGDNGSMQVAVAAGSQAAADAGAVISAAGGNAVDAAIAATLVLMIGEPGICAPGAGGFIAVRPAGKRPITIDANVSMPGAGADPTRFGQASRVAYLEYGGGVETTVGYESVATPGGLAGLGAAWEEFGAADWADVMAPAIEWAEVGSPLSPAARYYLEYSHQSIFGWHPISHGALHDDDGGVYPEGTPIIVPGLAETLRELAERGAADAYTGQVADRLAEDLQRGGSLVTRQDLATYSIGRRPSTRARIESWEVFTNPPPSIGGVVLTAMLELASRGGLDGVDAERLIEAQTRALRYRGRHLDATDDLEEATRAMLDELISAGGTRWITSPSTVHVSAVGEDGTACAITMSAGYGSGVVAGDTGFWMNNTLGEAELNRRGFHQLPVGTRVPSNMAPTIGLGDDGAVLAVGSPGADRITTALQQVILGVVRGRDLQDSVDAPRIHVESGGDEWTVAYEPGAGVAPHHTRRPFTSTHMFFGGVAAAMLDPERGLVAAADERRAGGVAIA